MNFRKHALMKGETKASLLSTTEKVTDVHESGGFKFKCIGADLQFECVERDTNGVVFEIVDADDHVRPVERSIRTVKEGIRCTIADVPFRRIPKIMTRSLVTLRTRNLNQFPSENGMSSSLSPLTIVTGEPKPDTRKFNLDFGSYVEVFEDNGFMQNSTRTRRAPASGIGPTTRRKVSHHFMSLATWRRLRRKKWHEPPMPD